MKTTAQNQKRPSYTDKEVNEAALKSIENSSDVRRMTLEERATLTRPKTTA